MTSAPNLRPPSNGNKFFRGPAALLVTCLLIFSSGCELFKPVGSSPTVGRDRPRTETPDQPGTNQPDDLDPIQSRRVFDPETGRYVYVTNAPTQKMDTVRWRLVSEEAARPITEEGTAVFNPVIDPNTSANNPDGGTVPVEQLGVGVNGSRMLSAYNVDYLLPFLANRLDAAGMDGGDGQPEIDPNSLWSLHFYSGAQMALDALRNENVSLNVSAQDTRAVPERTKSLINSQEFRNAQMIIGPYVRNNIAAVAEAVRNQEQVLVSPYSAAEGISVDNPNYIQVNPTLNTHLDNILRHAVNSRRGDRIVLVGGPNHRGRLAYLQEAYKVISNDVNVTPLVELIVEGTDVNLQPYLDGRGTVFIVPVYADESFVANFLRQAYDANRSNQDRMAVYGLPQWKNFSLVDFDYYEGTNVHISSSVFVDKLDPAVRQFRRDFYNRFKTIPREEAFVGYDITLYFARMISQHGTRFQYALTRNPEKMMHTEFRFEPIMTQVAEGNDFEQARVDHWENTFVNILQFRDYQFRKVN